MEKKSESLIMEAERLTGRAEVMGVVHGVEEAENINIFDVKKQMKVYRLENKEGYGPYNLLYDLNMHFPDRLKDIFCSHCDDSVEHPNRYYDKKLRKQWDNSSEKDFPSHWRFCFTDMVSLHKWFDDETLQLMKGVGVNIVEYVVPKDFVMVGDKQAIFKAEKAKRVLTS